jgi:hypothetical protein
MPCPFSHSTSLAVRLWQWPLPRLLLVESPWYRSQQQIDAEDQADPEVVQRLVQEEEEEKEEEERKRPPKNKGRNEYEILPVES